MSFKICTIGCGSIANLMHGPSYLKYMADNRDVVFAGCCDIDEARSKDFKEKFGFLEHYTDIDEMLIRQKPDAVCLISPVHMTAVLAGEILDMGFPLLLEKPPGRTKEEVMQLIEIAQRRNVPHRVAFNRRYAPLVRKLRDLLDTDFKSEYIQSLQYDMFRVNRLDEDFSTTAIHAIDAVRFITGSDYRYVRFVYREYTQLGSKVTDIHMLCTMKSGAVVQLDICPVTGINAERAVVNLYDNTFFLDFMGNELNTSGRLVSVQKNKIVLELSGNGMPDGREAFEKEGFYYENKSFFDDIRAGRNPTGDLISALQSVEVAECIRKRLPEYTAC
jgi:myo-inositol 2-dehydrogenase / D-chiro-inositol 1-dehydrogenase